MDFVDLHSHILPGLDDGSPDMTTSLRMIDGLQSLGFSTICATPHQKTGQYLPSLESIRRAHEEVVGALSERENAPRIPLAAENMWDETFYERMEAEEIPGYDGNPRGGGSFLLEFIPNQLPMGLFEKIFAMRLKGMLPVIAHPERYMPLWKDAKATAKLAENCAMVVDLGALAGAHGRKQAKAARKMVLAGIAHAAASDAHEPDDIEVAKAGIEWIRKKAGERAVQRLLGDNPRAILAGRHPAG